MAAVLDHGADDDRRSIERPVPAPPRLRQVQRVRIARQADVLLGAPGLAGDVDGEIAEDARRRAERGMRRLLEALLDVAQRGRIDSRGRSRLCAEATEDARRPAVVAR